MEGLIIKEVENSSYKENSRQQWYKLKKGLLNRKDMDSFDLLLIGAYYGKGKRKGVYGSYLLGCLNQINNKIEPITKIGTGFSEQNLIEQHQKLVVIENANLSDYSYDFNDSFPLPDVLFAPEYVWEVKFEQITLSPKYNAAHQYVQNEITDSLQYKGLSLRFPKFFKLRNDKSVQQVTSSKQIFTVYQKFNELQ